jgi:dTDP-4-dehydrorhamnose reductase
MLAQAIGETAQQRGHETVLAEHSRLDVTDAAAVQRLISREKPDAVIQCAGYTRVDDAEHQEAQALAVNRDGVANLVRACVETGSTVVYPSTDYVFDGRSTRPYRPDDATAPLNAYGRSKLAGEREAAKAARHLIVRTSWLYGGGGKNFVSTILQRARFGDQLRVVDDQRGSPTWTSDLAATMLALLDAGAPNGVYHASNSGETSWYGFACTALRLAGLNAEITAISTAELEAAAQRPRYSTLDCASTESWVGRIRPWQEALADALRGGSL